MHDWIGVIGSLTGVLVGGLLGHLVSVMRFRQERKWQTELQLRGKLEEIATLCDENFWRYSGSIRRTLEWGEGRRESPEVDLPSLGRLRTLVSFYCPQLRKDFVQIDEARDVAEKAIIEAGHARGAEKLVRQEANAELARAELRMQKACEALAAGVASLVSAEVKKAV